MVNFHGSCGRKLAQSELVFGVQRYVVTIIHEVSTLDDPRLEPFRDIRNRNWIRNSGWFVVEGPLLVERLLASDYECHSLLVDRKYLERFQHYATGETPFLVAAHEQMEQILGFDFHRGALACGIRRPGTALRSVDLHGPEQITLAALVGVQDPENVGGILRNCAALGVSNVLIGPRCADPFSRRALRVSAGNTLKLNIISSRAFVEDLRWLSTQSIRTLGASLRAEALPLAGITKYERNLVVVGNEKYGIPTEILAELDQEVCIPMQMGVSSLNVCVAAGILLHHFSRLQ